MYDWRADVEGLSELRQPWEQYGVQTSCGARLRDDRRREAGGARTSSMRQPQAKHQFKSTASMAGCVNGEGGGGKVVGGDELRGESAEEGAQWDDYKHPGRTHTSRSLGSRSASQIPHLIIFAFLGLVPFWIGCRPPKTLSQRSHSESQTGPDWEGVGP